MSNNNNNNNNNSKKRDRPETNPVRKNHLSNVLDGNDDIDEEEEDLTPQVKFESLIEIVPEGMCVECTDQPSVVRCSICKDDFCEVCSISVHRRGNRKTHTFISLTDNRELTYNQLNNYKLSFTGTGNSTQLNSNNNNNNNNNNSTYTSINPLALLNTNKYHHPILLPGTIKNNNKNSEDDQMDGGNGNQEEYEEEEEEEEDNSRYQKLDDNWFLERSKYIPLRLTLRERSDLRLLEAALHVSDYTDKIDIIHVGGGKSKRINEQLRQICAILSGLLVASDFKKGQKLIENKEFCDNEDFFQNVFEIGRRHKIMNPAKMRTEYGKMIHLLQDASNEDNKKNLGGLNMIKGLKTVYSFLEEKGGIALLEDSLLEIATKEILDLGQGRNKVQREIHEKEQAIKKLSKKYQSSTLRSEDIETCIYSICDNHTYLRENRDPVREMKKLLKRFFHPDKQEMGFSLGVEHGVNGARLTHSHRKQYHYVYQSLTLWKLVLHDMFRLWYNAEIDLLHGDASYSLSNTGQGLNRIQPAPCVSRIMSTILRKCQVKVGDAWVGSSVIHLGDHNVPNALTFIDKYTQISRILNPIVITLNYIPKIKDQGIINYIDNTFQSRERLAKTILCDFFKHAFDGSGADNFFDAGSCIDGRLTSAWNWCARIEKKSYYPVFLLAGFQSFDGSFSG